MSLLLVLNLRGKIDSTTPVRKALVELKVERRFSATVVPDDGPTLGMLKSCKDYVAWSPLDSKLLANLLKTRGMVSENRRLDQDALNSLGFKKYEDFADKIMKDGERLSAQKGIRPFFRLSPPKGGYKLSSRRQASEKGILGSNPKLAELVGRMV
ncbi:MAG TPA: uL30 family ribosomal protein [Nitrososphaerales archaeon]|nr:uL30 family ribosomal protein [Nitrososphaerales archaeon]